MARVALNPSFSEWGVTAGPGIVLGAYLVIFVFLAAGFYWLMQPTLAHKPGLPNTVVIHAKVPWVPPAPSEMPATVAIEGPATRGYCGCGHGTRAEHRAAGRLPNWMKPKGAIL